MLINSKVHDLGIAEMLTARHSSRLRNQILQQHNLSSVEWFVLGLIQSKSAAGGIRVTDLAAILDVQTTYITATINTLRSKNLIDSLKDRADARARLLIVTSTGGKIAAQIEHEVRAAFETRLEGKVTSEEFKNYVQVVNKIADIKTLFP